MAVNTVLYTNVMALTAKRNLASIGNKQEKSNKRLSSGKKINSATDDAAGLSISSKMKAQIKGLDMAAKNSEDAISLVQTAEGSLTEVNNMLTRVRELAVQASNDTNEYSDRVKIAEEVAELLTEIDDISLRTQFNGKKLNDGSLKNEFFQIGANDGQNLDLDVGSMSVSGIGIDEIMKSFGIEKEIALTGSYSDLDKGIVTESKISQVISNNMSDLKIIDPTYDLSKVRVSIYYSEKGVGSDHHFFLDLSKTKRTGNTFKSQDLLDELVIQLNKDPVFSKNLVVEKHNAALKISAKGPGSEIQLGQRPTPTSYNIRFDFDFGQSVGNGRVNPHLPRLGPSIKEYQDGTYGKIDFNRLDNGDTVTIAGKTFTKYSDSKTASNNYAGFSTIDELQTLLLQDGIVTEIQADGKLNLSWNFKNNPLVGTYSVNTKDISNNARDYADTLKTIDNALTKVNEQRAELGATQNRLEYTIKNLKVSSENLSSANSVLEDTDMAKEMMKLTQENIMQEAGISILAQSNQKPNQILDLLG